MDKVILVPTDFKVESLQLLKLAIDQHQDQKLKILLVYGERPSDSITELLFYRPYQTVNNLLNNAFMEAIHVLKNRYESTITSIGFKVFNGTTAASLRTFVEANSIDEAFISRSYNFQLKNNGFDLTPLIIQSKIPFREFGEMESQELPDAIQLNVLFNQ